MSENRQVPGVAGENNNAAPGERNIAPRSVIKTSDGIIRTASRMSLGSKKAAMEAVRKRREWRRKVRKAYKYMLAVAAGVFVILLVVLASRSIRNHSGRADQTAENTAEGNRGAVAGEANGDETGANEEGENIPSTAVRPEGDPNKVTFSAVGDNLIHGSIFEQAKTRADGDGYDFSYSYAPVASYFEQRDLNWINMETIVNDQYPASTYPRFSTPGADAKALYDIGFRVFSVSSNHTYDFGNRGVRSMKYFYRDDMPDDILTTGLWEDTGYIPIYECKGHKIAFLTYTYGMNQHSNEESGRVIYLTEKSLIRSQIKSAKEKADCVVVSCHWGDEDNHGINDEQRRMARQIADWGADLIIGTHPHVAQDYTRLETSDGRKVFCAYSIGNFISGQKDIDHLVGLILECTLAFSEDSDGNTKVEVEEPKLIPVITHYDEGFTNIRVMMLADYTPELADRHGVQHYHGFTYDGIFTMLKSYVIGDVLELPEQKSRISGG